MQDHGELERPPLTTVVALRPASATRSDALPNQTRSKP